LQCHSERSAPVPSGTAHGVEEALTCLFQDEPCREFLQLQTELSMIAGENACAQDDSVM
jgi:hypothetical protein